MGDSCIATLQEGFRSSNSSAAWELFLSEYSSVLYQAARTHSHDEDGAADCFLYLCERLAENNFRRLLKFKPAGTAKFTTWLHVVARNLCFDWHRVRSGRPRPFKSLHGLSTLELEIYNCRFVQGASQEQTLQQLEPVFPELGLSQISEIEDRLQGSLSSRQQWILSMRKQSELGSTVAIAEEEDEAGISDVPDPRPTQEMRVAKDEQQAHLRKHLASLPAEELLLVQLRFEQELSLDEIARLCQLGDAQRVHRKLAAVLKKLQRAMCK